MRSISHATRILIISLTIFTVYPQQLWINCMASSGNEFEIVEKSVVKNLDYLKEDIKIPQLKNENNNLKIKSINRTINNDISPKIEAAEKISKEYFQYPAQGNPKFPYEIYSRYTITEDNNMIISLYNDYYEYLGGAHGMTTRTSYTIDKNKGVILNLKDLFKENYNYREIINEEIKKEISKNPENYFDSASEFKGINENQNFYIQGKNLVVYYQLYDIAPYVFGFPEFKIPLELFAQNYVYPIADKHS